MRLHTSTILFSVMGALLFASCADVSVRSRCVTDSDCFSGLVCIQGTCSGASEALGRIDISDAEVLVISGDGASNELFKIYADGSLATVDFIDDDGNIFDFPLEPFEIFDVNGAFLIATFFESGTEHNTGYLVRKADGAVFDLGGDLPYNGEEFFNRTAVQSDGSGNLYLLALVDTPQFYSGGRVFKLDTQDPNAITKTAITPETDNVDSYYVSSNGAVVVDSNFGPEGEGEHRLRLRKPEGGFVNVADEYASFLDDLDGNLLAMGDFGDDFEGIYQVTFAPSGDISYDFYGEAHCARGFNTGDYPLDVTDRILIVRTNSDYVCDVLDSSGTPQTILFSELDGIRLPAQSDDHYYLLGDDSGGAPVLIQIDSTDDSVTREYEVSNFDIFKFVVSDDDYVSFHALRLSDSKRVIGSFAPNGTLTILEESDDLDVSVLVRIQ